MITFVLAQAERGGPLGPEFGKASPIGLLIIVLMLVAVLYIGWALTRRIKRMARRRAFAESHGIDVFDQEAIDKAIAAEGLAVDTRKQWF